MTDDRSDSADWLALDVGGANLKASDGCEFAKTIAFPLWRKPEELGDALAALIAASPPCDRLAVTMTGELADCFASKAEGVRHILAAVQQAGHGRPTWVYLVTGQLVDSTTALRQPNLAAAANWHALARFAGQFTAQEESALFVDIGSTTCDIIPLGEGQPTTDALTDTQRHLRGHLVYTGVSRSPLCAILRRAPYRDDVCPVAQELFATMRDVFIVLGELPEDADDHNTADGRPATRAFSIARLGRMLCADAEEFGEMDAVVVAQAAYDEQTRLLANTLTTVVQSMSRPPSLLVTSGLGEFLAKRAWQQVETPSRHISLRDKLGPEVSTCASAFALAAIARRYGPRL